MSIREEQSAPEPDRGRAPASVLRAVPDLLALVGLAYLVFGVVRGRLHGPFRPAHDVYAYYLPNMLYAARQWAEGGAGLLWNPLQSCGQPFLANALVGLFYPVNWVFAVAEPDRALILVILINVGIAALGCYALFRQLGASMVPALSGTAVFVLGPMTMGLTTWSPIHIGSYCWLPVALLFTERLLVRPTAARAASLGTVLTLCLLPGYPQVALFIYLTIGVRVLVALPFPAPRHKGRVVACFAAACLLPALLGAVAFLPFGEFWQESLRSRPLSVEELTSLGNRAAKLIRIHLIQHWRLHIVVVLGALALSQRRLRQPAVFYLLWGALVVALAHGTDGPLGVLFDWVPGARLFRQPDRFVWLFDICCAALVALGLEAATQLLGRGIERASARRPSGLGSAGYALGLFASIAIPVAVTWQVLQVQGGRQRLLESSDPLWHHAETFGAVRARMTSQDRAYLAHAHPFESSFAFMQKSASLFEVASLFDYEPMTPRRYAEYFVLMRAGRPMQRLDDFLLNLQGWLSPHFSWPMHDAAAGRFLVFSASERLPKPRPWLRRVESSGDPELIVYENRNAQPRARFVGGVRVVEDPDILLERLVGGTDPLDRIALMESEPPSGFLGSAEPAPGASVEFAQDEPERIVLDVDAPRRGFLFLADTHYPGWRATVEGSPAPILRANHAFRLIEVPAGRSRVELRFRPTSLIVGAILSTLTAFGILAALLTLRGREARP